MIELQYLPSERTRPLLLLLYRQHIGQRQQQANIERHINENTQKMTIPSVLMFSLKCHLTIELVI